MDVEKISVDGFNLNVSDAKARDMISDKYDPDNGTYVVGDTCINDDILYICNTDIDTPEDFDSSKWDADTVGHYCTELKSNLTDLTTNTDSTSGKIHFTKENKMRRVDLQWTSYSALKSFFNNLSSADKPKGAYINIVTTTVNSYYVNLAFVECNATNIICYRCSAYNNGNVTFAQCGDNDSIKGSFTWYVD